MYKKLIVIAGLFSAVGMYAPKTKSASKKTEGARKKAVVAREEKIIMPDAGWATDGWISLPKMPQSSTDLYSSTDISSESDAKAKRTKKVSFSDPLPAPRSGHSSRTPRATRKQSASSRVVKKPKKVSFADLLPSVAVEERSVISHAANLRKVHQKKEGTWVERKPVHRSVSRLREEVSGSGASAGAPLPSLARKLTAAQVPAARAKMNATSPQNRKERERRMEQEVAAQRAKNPFVVEDYFSASDE